MKKKKKKKKKANQQLYIPVNMSEEPIFTIITDINSVDKILITVYIWIPFPQAILPETVSQKIK